MEWKEEGGGAGGIRGSELQGDGYSNQSDLRYLGSTLGNDPGRPLRRWAISSSVSVVDL